MSHEQRANDETQPPPAVLRTETFRRTRPSIVGGEIPEPPFPITLSGAVQHGFGRGGRDLGCHTANLPDDILGPMASIIKTGIYFGYAQVHRSCPQGQAAPLPEDDLKVWPMVMSLGLNPFYKNKKLTAEVHVLHVYEHDFYGHEMSVVILGYIRPEFDYLSREALIEDINTDKQVALNSLSRPAYGKYAKDPAFRVD